MVKNVRLEKVKWDEWLGGPIGADTGGVDTVGVDTRGDEARPDVAGESFSED